MKRILLFTLLLSATTLGAQTYSFDDGWRFALGNAAWPEFDFGAGTEYFNYLTKAASIHNTGPYTPTFDDSAWEEVQLPHDWVVDLPYDSDASHSHGYKVVGWRFPETSVGWYRKHFLVPEECRGQNVFLRFDGIFRDSQVWVNGFYLGGEPDGYIGASYRVGEYLNYGGDNVVTVRADASLEEGWFYEGAGIYRHAFLVIDDGKLPGMKAAAPPMRPRLPEIVFDPDKGLFVDGEHVELRGANLHQDHAGVGSGIPDALYVYMVRQLKKYGFNAIRTSHNPASPVLLDICDSLGMYVLEETRAFGINEVQLEPLRKMIERDRHHPCIIAWGIGNEEWGVEWKPEGEAIARVMTEFCHTIDPTRPVFVATSGGPEIIKGVDLAGYNYILQNDIDGLRVKYPSRIAIGTEETSGCGTRGVYFDDRPHGRMAALNRSPQGPDSLLNCIERGLKFYRERPWLAGLFYWTGFDYRGEPNPLSFPATGSEFGILDYCGFPKDEAFYLKSWWTDEPVLHILPHWNLEGHEGETVSVWVYSNCDEVSLTVNGKNLGRKKMPVCGHLEWDAVYKPGTVIATGYKGGRKVMTEIVQTAGSPAKLAAEVDRSVISADRQDLSVVDVSVLDARSVFAPTACIPVTVTVSGPVRILGAGNGDPAFVSAERPRDRSARSFTLKSFNGHVQFLIQSTGESGSATVTLSSPGLTEESFTITTEKPGL